MTQKLLQMMQAKGYFNQHKKILVAVSGGADSMSLLHFLYNHQKDLDIQLGIAHVNHKQRQESEHEEAYLRHWAKEHKVPFTIVPSQESFQKMLPVPFAMSFLSGS